MGEIVRGAHQGALLFGMEPRLDVLSVNSLKQCKETQLFGLWRICKKCNNTSFLKWILVIFNMVGCFFSTLTE